MIMQEKKPDTNGIRLSNQKHEKQTMKYIYQSLFCCQSANKAGCSIWIPVLNFRTPIPILLSLNRLKNTNSGDRLKTGCCNYVRCCRISGRCVYLFYGKM